MRGDIGFRGVCSCMYSLQEDHSDINHNGNLNRSIVLPPSLIGEDTEEVISLTALSLWLSL